MKDILKLNNEEAKTLLLKRDSYSNISLPEYFSFQELLDKIDKTLKGKNISDFRDKSPRDIENVNYKLLSNKDGKFAWRPFQLINPAIYVSLVNTITEKTNWEILKDRFAIFQANDKIECHSLPAISESKTKTNKTAQILNWWQMIEQKSLTLSLDYKYVLHTDIADCYSSIYTHSIPWAIHTKEKAKKNRKNSLLGNAIDNHLQDMSYGQTNGIPQGSVLMDFIAEIVLGYVDLLLTEKLDLKGITDYRILRFRDDYRIFTNNSFEAEQIAKEHSEILSNIGLKLNAGKTIASDDIIKSSLKPDKRYWISNKIITGNKQKWLIQLYLLSEKFPNSGTIDTQMREFLIVLQNSKKKDYNLKTLISLVTEIALRNPRVVPTCIAILSIFLSGIKDDTEKLVLAEKIRNKFKEVPNSSFMMVWFQRLNLKINKTEIYTEPLCKKIADNSVVIWNIEWLNDKLKNIFNKTPIIREKVIIKTKKKVSKSEIKKIIKKAVYYE
jgi:RNA-directed DNA polymerase